MAVIDYIDGTNRRIYLHLDTVGVDFEPMDVYYAMRTLRRTDETLRKYNLFLEAKGKEPKGGGTFTERYVVELEGTRIVPYDTDQVLNVVGTIITDDGQSGVACFDRSLLTPTVHVDINYVPPQVEVIEKSVSGLTSEESAALLNLETDVDYIKNMEAGEWKVENNQMVQYDINNVEMKRFNLFDENGNPAMIDVYRRVPV